ncbi:putative fatty acid activator [Rosellinia necatrix]|uniref:Putative fatty acid activator n=1 Tax=Rosellinia necatrix TaxID=77044 RepID=A0A1S8A6B5_ROSNE|nr:putative fatty acid activator [Rosellinia necatrix]
MHTQKSFRSLSPKTRIGVGLALLAWGAVGLHLSDRAEERFFKPTDEDRAALRNMVPQITAVERDGGNKPADGGRTS